MTNEEIKERLIEAHRLLLDQWENGYRRSKREPIKPCPLCQTCIDIKLSLPPKSALDSCRVCTQMCTIQKTVRFDRRGFPDPVRAEYHRKMIEYLSPLPPEAFSNMAKIRWRSEAIDQEVYECKKKKETD
jgi:hypothetical protein